MRVISGASGIPGYGSVAGAWTTNRFPRPDRGVAPVETARGPSTESSAVGDVCGVCKGDAKGEKDDLPAGAIFARSSLEPGNPLDSVKSNSTKSVSLRASGKRPGCESRRDLVRRAISLIGAVKRKLKKFLLLRGTLPTNWHDAAIGKEKMGRYRYNSPTSRVVAVVGASGARPHTPSGTRKLCGRKVRSAVGRGEQDVDAIADGYRRVEKHEERSWLRGGLP
ncbi:hypothetical protein KM043_004818 [Ampulex compressa]|nr:hypothetical protein KM043_004818 [Ampulex compressa]